VMICLSAGLAPAPIVQSLTKKVMEAKNIKLDDHFPKNLDQVALAEFDLVINMSGRPLPPQFPVKVRDWKVEDPIGQSEEVYITVRDQIENAVMQLVLEFRRDLRKQATPKPERRSLGGVIRRR
jgi:arsenate reductase